MKHPFLFGLILLLMTMSCKKQEVLFTTPVNDLYIFKPDDSHPLNKRIYEIYRDYGVALFFQDTVGQYFVRNDVNGQPYYRTERLDLGWSFNSYKKVKFNLIQITDLQEQLRAIDYVEKYLQSIARPLYPFSILLVRELQEESSSGEITSFKKGEAVNYFRTLMMTDQLVTTDTLEHFKGIVKTIVRSKLDGFPDALNQFGAVSNSKWYDGKKYSDLDPTVTSGTSVGLLYTPELEASLRRQGYTDARIEAEKVKLRRVCGQFGFVSGNNFGGGYYTPGDVSQDLNGFVREMLSCNKAVFHERWGKYPLVMKKYNILYELISTKLGFEL